MLLRSSSNQILKSLQEPDSGHRIHRIQATRCVSLPLIASRMKMSRALSESNLEHFSILKTKTLSNNHVISPVLLEDDEGGGKKGLYLTAAAFSGDESLVGNMCNVAAVHGGGGGENGDGGGGGDGNGDSGGIDGYYQKMIKAYPGDPLLLGNYAKFLKEVKGDAAKAEEYCERAILAKANDGNVLSMYGDLIWNNHKDGQRAQNYFDQAVQSAPDDCYVLASYARFLWDAGEEEEEEEEVEINSIETLTPHPSPKQACSAAA